MIALREGMNRRRWHDARPAEADGLRPEMLIAGLAVVIGLGCAAVDNRVDGDAAGHFARGRAAHAVADDEESLLGLRRKRIFVDRANPPCVGGRADAQSHARQLIRSQDVRRAIHSVGTVNPSSRSVRRP